MDPYERVKHSELIVSHLNRLPDVTFKEVLFVLIESLTDTLVCTLHYGNTDPEEIHEILCLIKKVVFEKLEIIRSTDPG